MGELETELDRVLALVDFTHPVELADVLAVDARIREALPGIRLESYHTNTEVHFTVRGASDVLARRSKKVAR